MAFGLREAQAVLNYDGVRLIGARPLLTGAVDVNSTRCRISVSDS